LFWKGPKYIDFVHVLPALEHHTYSEDDAEDCEIKIKGGGRKKGKQNF
jgi:hypothetical protein